eukprot:6645539-Prymnesium_polylepis.2
MGEGPYSTRTGEEPPSVGACVFGGLGTALGLGAQQGGFNLVAEGSPKRGAGPGGWGPADTGGENAT